MSVEARPDFIVVGAGPAGATFARLMSDRGYEVLVFEAAPWPGLKPCGWAVPKEVEEYIKIPAEVVLTKVKGFRVYLDGTLLRERRSGLWGYIINKPSFLKLLLEGVEVKYKTLVRVGPHGPIRLGSIELNPREAVVIAAGPTWEHAPSERIFCLQTTARLYEPVDPSVIEFWFESDLVGYYWVFPEDERRVRLGVGGFASIEELYSKLAKFVSQHPALKRGELEEPARGAPIVVSGVQEELLRAGNPVIGEAAGFVMPLSGEGIRPSIASAYALALKFTSGNDPLKVLKDLITWTNRQRRFVELLLKSKPQLRAEVLRKVPLEVAVDIALGRASVTALSRLLGILPSTLARILASLASGSS